MGSLDGEGRKRRLPVAGRDSGGDLGAWASDSYSGCSSGEGAGARKDPRSASGARGAGQAGQATRGQDKQNLPPCGTGAALF